MKISKMIRTGEGGYNLVEVLVAMAMLGTVLISLVTLFVMGQRNVYSGKQMTRAVAAGTRIMEDISPLTQVDVIDAFGLDTATAGTVTAGGESYANSVVRSTATDAGDATKDADGYLTEWDKLLDQEEFNDGRITIVMTPIDPLATSSAPGLTNSPILRIRALVEWNEGVRERRILLETSKVNRVN